MQMQLPDRFDACAEFRLDYAGLVRAAMRRKQITKTRLRDAGIIRKCTWRCFDQRLDSGEISSGEMERILRFLDIDFVGASLVLVCLENVDEYFEPTCEAAALLARGLITSLTKQASLLDGNFSPLKAGLYASIAERHAQVLIEHQLKMIDLQTRDFGLER